MCTLTVLCGTINTDVNYFCKFLSFFENVFILFFSFSYFLVSCRASVMAGDQSKVTTGEADLTSLRQGHPQGMASPYPSEGDIASRHFWLVAGHCRDPASD